MIRRLLAAALAATLVAALPSGAAAQVVRDFTPRFVTNDNGDIALIGNTLMSCSGGGSCPGGRNGTGSREDNEEFTMQYVDADADAATFSSSSATLALPPGAVVLWAGLHWVGYSTSPARGNVKFAAPGGGYVPLAAGQLDASGAIYHGFVDVTATVQAAGNGVYWTADVQSTPGVADRFAGWSLVVAYRLPSEPMRNLVVFDGFATVGNGPWVDVPVSGFLTPTAGVVTTRVGVVAADGDLGSSGDRLEMNGIRLNDAVNPSNNVFNSTISRLGARLTDKNPDYVNQLGFDVDLVGANGLLANGVTSAVISLKSGSDAIYPAVVTFATDIYVPVLSGSGFQKRVADLNGGAAQPGDLLEYTLDLRNLGLDDARQTVVRDTLPANAVYEPGSIVVLTGPNPGARTDAAGDDDAEWDAAGRVVTLRLGAGATAAAGGTLAPGVATTARFRARVATPSPTGSVVSNQATASFYAPQIDATMSSASDADTVAAGEQRTEVTVDASLIAGTVFEDPHYGGGAGRPLAASGGAGRPGARVELYDASGAYQGFVTTGPAGDWVFDGWGPGSDVVRVVNASVTSSRPGATPALIGVQTYRTTAPAGIPVGDPDRVGGETPGLPDAGPNPGAATLAALGGGLAAPQSLAPVTIGTADLASVDFGFNFSTVVNARASGQGSLAQFVLNANALQNAGLAQAGLAAGTEHAVFMVSDGLAHPGLRAGLANLLTGGVVRIVTATGLPAITDAFTRVDGATQTLNVGDTNPGAFAGAGAAGVDAVAMPAVARPEVEIVDAGGAPLGLDVQAPDVTLAHLAVSGFGNAPGSDAHADVRIGAGAHRALLTGLVLGSAAGAFADPGAAARSGGDHVRVTGADDVTIERSLAGFGLGNGIALAGGSDRARIEGCEIRGNALAGAAHHGVSLENAAGARIADGFVTGHPGAGVDAGSSAGQHVFENLTVSGNGAAGGAGARAGLRLGGPANRVDRCVVTGNGGAGVLAVASADGNVITRNRMSGNGPSSGQIGIDLLSAADDPLAGSAPYRTLNDVDDADAGANGLPNFPVLHGAVLRNGSFTLSGWARPGSAIEVFVAAPDPSGFGEGETWLGTFTEGSAADLDGAVAPYSGPVNGLDQGADATQRFRFTIPVPAGVGPGVQLTATATLASGTSEFSGLVTVTAGVVVSGWGYADLDHDGQRDAGENGAGVAAWAKIVSPLTPLVAYDVAPIDPGTGAYAFGFVTSGDWTIVLDDNGLASDVAPGYPAGHVGTEAGSGIRALVVAGSDASGQNFGLWHGSRVEGAVFRDDGAGGGVPNDGARQGGEAGVAGVRVRAGAAACASGACDSTLTDAAGAFALWLPGAAAGAGVIVSETNAAAWISTGASPGATGGAYDRPADALAFTPANGVIYAGVAFGDVPPNQLAAPGVRSGYPGAAAFPPHAFVAGSSGTVSFSALQSPAPPLPGWSWALVHDLDCDGVPDAGEPDVSAPLAVSGGQSLCLVLRHQIPAGATPGAAEVVSLSAAMTYANASPVLVTTVRLDDRTTVIDAGSLQLVKSVDLATAAPGALLNYTITYTNLGPEPLSAIVIQDATPAFTVFEAAGCGALGAGLSGCSVTTSPAVGGTGAVTWSLAGALAPGESGSVTFRVRVE